MSWLSDLFGGGQKPAQAVQAPAFTPDPTYTSEQAFLQPYSQGLLTGNNIPAYYQSIGKQNSPEFQSALNLSNKQVGTSAAEGMAMAGTGRSGLLPQTYAQTVGDNTAALTYQDFLNSNAGKEFLMGQGQNATNTVMNAALTNQGQVNNYNLAATGINNNTIAYNNSLSAQEAAQQGAMLGSILNGGFLNGVQNGLTSNANAISNIGSFFSVGSNATTGYNSSNISQGLGVIGANAGVTPSAIDPATMASVANAFALAG